MRSTDPDARFPTELKGVWIHEEYCAEYRRTGDRAGSGLEFRETSMDREESSESINVQRRTGPGRWTFEVSWDGEGETGQATRRFRMERNVLIEDGETRYVRCRR